MGKLFAFFGVVLRAITGSAVATGIAVAVTAFLTTLGGGALSELGRFMMRFPLFALIVGVVYFLITYSITLFLSIAPISTIFEAFANTNEYQVIMYIFWLSGIDVLLTVFPAVMSARFVIDRVTFPL